MTERRNVSLIVLIPPIALVNTFGFRPGPEFAQMFYEVWGPARCARLHADDLIKVLQDSFYAELTSTASW